MTHQITFLRHGQSVANHEGIIQGHLDFPLSALGRQQAETRAEAWASERRAYDLIVSSPLQRASQTATILSNRLSVPVEHDAAWKERYLGEAQGMTLEAFLEATRNASPKPPFSAAYANGEGTWDLYRRAAAAVQGIVRRAPGRYLVVSHGGILNAALRTILGIAPVSGLLPRLDLGNCGYADVSLNSDGAWTVHSLCNPAGAPAPDDDSDR
jgi:broad specificity phosphatase PhoE